MLVIRLQRVGKKNRASFRIVLQDKKWQPQGKALELLGHYDPHSKDRKVQEERIKYWISKGAQVSPTLNNMFVDMKVIDGPKVQARKLTAKSSTKEESAKEEVASEEKSAPTAPTTPTTSESEQAGSEEQAGEKKKEEVAETA